MGNTIQQPPQLIDSANVRQDGVYHAGSQGGQEGGPSAYESALESGFSYPPEDLSVVTNGYPPAASLYEPQAKYAMYSQFPNGSANGYGAIRGAEGPPDGAGKTPLANLAPTPKPAPPPSPPSQSPPPAPPAPEPLPLLPHHLPPPPASVLPSPPPPLLFPSSPPPLPHSTLAPPPAVISSPPLNPKKTSSPEIKLKIIKTYHNGRELFESSLCGDLLQQSSGKLKEFIDRPCSSPVSSLGYRLQRLVGDLVWAKVGTYPWWPCMVSCDPQANVHTRINTRGHREYHVQFFGSVAERAWVHEKRVVEYEGRDQFELLQAETLRKTTNPVERQKLLRPIPQRERAQWEVGVGHAEDAHLMTREGRIESYTFIYVDPEDGASPPRNPSDRKATRPERKARRSRGSWSSRGSAETPPRRQQPKRQCSLSGGTGAEQQQASEEEEEEEKEEDEEAKPSSPAPLSTDPSPEPRPPSPKPAWKTAAARKLLPLSITMKRLNVEITKCDWTLYREKAPSEARPRSPEAGSKQAEPSRCSPRSCSGKVEAGVKDQEKQERTVPPAGRRGEQERKPQRRSIRSRSESEKASDPVPKKKVKKEQARASEISDSCKPLKKRSRASTDVELVSSQYRDTSDSDSRGLSDQQVEFEKSSDSPAAADADGSDAQSVDSNLSSDGSCASRKDTICEQFGDALLACVGDCNRRFHAACLGLDVSADEKFTCAECKTGTHACFSCKANDGDIRLCTVGGCGRFYHESCARKHTGVPAEAGGLRCPQHSCATCRLERDMHKACKVAYHVGDGCVAAGSMVITPHIIICSSHAAPMRGALPCAPLSVGCCFQCSRGLLVQDRTDIILRSYAYKSHYLLTESNRAEKLPMIPSSSADAKKNVGKGAWLCGDCRAGKKPRYKQIVWAKLGNYSLGRVFPYVESDRNIADGQIGINKTFKKALEEAAKRFQELKAQRESKEALEQERHQCRKPPPYKFIKVQVHVADLSEIPRCNCRPTDESPCSQESQCLNRMLQYECHPEVCPAGARCQNQCFSQGRGPPTEGDFVMEYVGELIDAEECRQRIKRAHENRGAGYRAQFCSAQDRVIDAGPKGNFSRFMNHSCSPNCETQKWTVNGDVRIGLFAVCDIEAEAELTFNYNLDCLGNGRTTCQCGEENCSGFLGVRPKCRIFPLPISTHVPFILLTTVSVPPSPSLPLPLPPSCSQSAVVIEKEEKARNARLKPKKRRVKVESRQTHDYFCFRCSEGGELVMCDKKDCPKAYHLLCLNLTKPPFGRWECPWHHCSVCQRPASSFCEFCPTSFCRDHEKGSLVPSALEGRPCCPSHNPLSPLDPSIQLGKVTVKLEPLELELEEEEEG
ncbi:hypothetical protein JZ751_025345 [Albula glossodonta]|uniref:Histone-lysine N-methyltransferase NSD3 n=1 Tax=Albula glossodonta TaxID=121402 RepID=A0A8T2MWP3_9TELE|nr:hypothetical protein JZ751_025345 [Albula glossodonta]